MWSIWSQTDGQWGGTGLGIDGRMKLFAAIQPLNGVLHGKRKEHGLEIGILLLNLFVTQVSGFDIKCQTINARYRYTQVSNTEHFPS